MSKQSKSSYRSGESEQDRKQREHAEKFLRGELRWQKAAEKPKAEPQSEIKELPAWFPRGPKQQHLRKFPTYPVEQVMEVARMLYALRPFERQCNWSFTSLAQQAFDFLDNLHNAIAEIAKRRSATDAAYRRREKRSGEVAALPDTVPFAKAIRFITRQAHTMRAEKKFETLMFSMPRYFGNATKKELRALIRRWRKEGMPRQEVAELHSLHDNAVRKLEARRDQTHKRKRAKWPRQRIEKKLSETAEKNA